MRQGVLALHTARGSPITPPVISNDKLRRLFESLGDHDRFHLISAYYSVTSRTDDHALQLGVLLHDIGKVTLSGRQISLAMRVVAVLVRTAPRWIQERFRTERDGAWLTGPWLAEHHAQLGAERVGALGVPAEICRLVAQHDDPEVADDRLRLLREIDSAIL